MGVTSTTSKGTGSGIDGALLSASYLAVTFGWWLDGGVLNQK